MRQLPRMTRRALLALLPALLLATLAAPARAGITVTDLTGHRIQLEQPARRLLISDGRFLLALSLLHPRPVSLLAAWPRDIHRIGPDVYAQLQAAEPALATLPAVAESEKVQSVEQILATRPDLAVFPLGANLPPEQRAAIEAAGIPVLTIDFFTHPLANVNPSLRLLGQVIGADDQAERLIAFREAHLKRISDAVAGLPASARPKVFLEPHAGMTEECCPSPGNGNIGEYIEFVGGRNIGRAAIPTATGRLSLEYILTQAPEVYIATGGPHMARRQGVVLGPGFTAEQARASLARILTRPGFADLPAVRHGRVHALAHQMLNSPLDILALEELAKAIHPDLFESINLDQTKQTIEADFSTTKINGLFWIDPPIGGM
ncbi:MAG: hypothetical protein RLZZ501_2547 [Pseudomonadota bacterium]